MIKIAAVIATHSRPGLLDNRALASVEVQTRPPDYLLVVDDSGPQMRPANKEVVAGFGAGGVTTVYLENRRTPGLSGACNSALSWLQSVEPEAYVAFLDDDDMWEPTYLERCEEAVARQGLDMVAAGIVYHSSFDDSGGYLDIPDRLDVDELLIRNPHIQGSNLFVRLQILLEAGGFDEGLASTTDRDVCIRLADLRSVRFGSLPEHLVHHYAEEDRLRLSTPGSEAKCLGLTRFFRKYNGRMSGEQRAAFLRRSREMFGCDADAAMDIPPVSGPARDNPVPGESLDLVVGAITSPEVAGISRLMDDLVTRIAWRDDVTLKVILLENGGTDHSSRKALTEAVAGASEQGLDVTVKTLEDQASDVEAGMLSATPDQLSGRKSIAASRTMLQHYLYLEAKPRPGAVVWILDDDVRLDSLAYEADGHIQPAEVDYVPAIMQLRDTGNEVVIGEVTGDPPLPALSCVRTQLVDLYHNLQQLARLGPDTPYPDRSGENKLARSDVRDYYYDLSRSETGHLESPFWYEAGRTGLRAADAFKEMVLRLPEILAGRQVFRPLVHPGGANVADGLVPSVRRGPNTLVFDVDALREFPNAAAAIEGTGTSGGAGWSRPRSRSGRTGRRVQAQTPASAHWRRTSGDTRCTPPCTTSSHGKGSGDRRRTGNPTAVACSTLTTMKSTRRPRCIRTTSASDCGTLSSTPSGSPDSSAPSDRSTSGTHQVHQFPGGWNIPGTRNLSMGSSASRKPWPRSTARSGLRNSSGDCRKWIPLQSGTTSGSCARPWRGTGPTSDCPQKPSPGPPRPSSGRSSGPALSPALEWVRRAPC